MIINSKSSIGSYFNFLKVILINSAFLFLLNSCAQMAVPSGGEKDQYAPLIDEEKTNPKNRSTNFNSKRIEIVFDEYIKLTNPQQQIIISPALAETPKYLVKGKTLSILLTEELKPSTTYSINFGSSITDITEGNSTKDLQYVFSTGAYIDSFSVSGVIKNAFTGKPEKGIKVMLNTDFSDSSALKLKPDYFAVTNELGYYQIKYVKTGSYQLYAIKDANSNYLFNPESEEMAFHPFKIDLNADNPAATIDLYLFKEEQKRQFIKKKIFEIPGKATYVLNAKMNEQDREKVSNQLSTSALLSVWKSEDTLLVYYPFNYDKEIYLPLPNGIIDTSKFLFKEKELEQFKNNPLIIRASVPVIADLTSYLKLQSALPIEKIDLEKIQLIKDSIPVDVQWNKISSNELLSNYSFLKDAKNNYTLILSAGAIQSVYGQVNKTDTLKFSSQKYEYYGVLLINLSTVYENYILQLVNDRGIVVNEYLRSGNQEFKIEYVKPGNYSMRLVIDENHNNKWDTGDYLKKTQPERMINYLDAIQVRSNWDVEIVWKIN